MLAFTFLQNGPVSKGHDDDEEEAQITLKRRGHQVIHEGGVYKSKNFSSIELHHLEDLGNDDIFLEEDDDGTTTVDDDETLNMAEEALKREPILALMEAAGVKHVDDEILVRMPTWETVTSLYGKTFPLVWGMDTCQAYRDRIPKHRRMAAVAGLFNTGTNALWVYLRSNLALPYNKNNNNNQTIMEEELSIQQPCDNSQCQGMLERVPWDKHFMLSYRNHYNCGNHHIQKSKQKQTQPRECRGYQAYNSPERLEEILPIAIVRDPYTWMQSMCKTPYVVRWPHVVWDNPQKSRHNIYTPHDIDQRYQNRKAPPRHCPNLVPTLEEFDKRNWIKPQFDYMKLQNNESVPVYFKILNTTHSWPSLAHLWSSWYTEYIDTDIPRLMVRFEDLLFNPEGVLEKIQECVDADWKVDGVFRYVVDTTKAAHGLSKTQTNMISGIIKYGSGKTRLKGMTREDMIMARKALDPKLMKLFSYNQPPIPKTVEVDF